MTAPRWLSGWKQIARHFDISVATARRWSEGRGMPVVRGAGMVSGEISALDEWRRGCHTASSCVKERQPEI
jgi:hypothetical protein